MPEKFKVEGSNFTVSQVKNLDDIKRLLILKLIEEANEFGKNPSAEEMADIREVLHAIETHFDLNPAEVKRAQEEKRNQKGGFQEGYVMKLDPK